MSPALFTLVPNEKLEEVFNEGNILDSFIFTLLSGSWVTSILCFFPSDSSFSKSTLPSYPSSLTRESLDCSCVSSPNLSFQAESKSISRSESLSSPVLCLSCDIVLQLMDSTFLNTKQLQLICVITSSVISYIRVIARILQFFHFTKVIISTSTSKVLVS